MRVALVPQDRMCNASRMPFSLSNLPSTLRSTMNNLPPAVIFFNPRNSITHPCVSCRALVRSEFPPAYCRWHRNNITPPAGWVYATDMEVAIINILRRHNWTEHQLALLNEEALAADTAAMTVADHSSDEDEASSPPPSASPAAQAFTAMQSNDSEYSEED